MDAETLYHQVGRLIEEQPDFSGHGALNQTQLTWIGRAHALVKESSDIPALTEFNLALQNINGALRQDSLQTINLVLYKVLASAELKAPPNIRGSFIPAGNRFDAFAAVTKLFQSATTDVLIVDPYLDETILTEFGASVSSGTKLRLLADQSSVKASLTPAANNWVAQYSTSRPLEVRLAPARKLHDRAVFIDSKIAWVLTQSFKDFAKRSPAEIVKADDIAALKITAYESIWASATVIV